MALLEIQPICVVSVSTSQCVRKGGGYLDQLKEIMLKKYGEEVASMVFKEEDSYACKAGIQSNNFKPDNKGFKFLDVS